MREIIWRTSQLRKCLTCGWQWTNGITMLYQHFGKTGMTASVHSALRIDSKEETCKFQRLHAKKESTSALHTLSKTKIIEKYGIHWDCSWIHSQSVHNISTCPVRTMCAAWTPTSACFYWLRAYCLVSSRTYRPGSALKEHVRPRSHAPTYRDVFRHPKRRYVNLMQIIVLLTMSSIKLISLRCSKLSNNQGKHPI